MARRLEEVGSIALVERALGDIRKGKMVVLTDDEDRENEGDLVMAAAKVTPAAINFMATHARLDLLVNKDNGRAIAFYEKHGFEMAGDDVNPVSGRPVFRMRWPRRISG